MLTSTNFSQTTSCWLFQVGSAVSTNAKFGTFTNELNLFDKVKNIGEKGKTQLILKKKRLVITFTSVTIFISKPITTQCRILMQQRCIAVENIVRKEEIACSKQLLFFP